MSRPKYYWYWIAKKMIMEYAKIEEDNSEQAVRFKNAIDGAMKITKGLPNGDLRIKAIKWVLITKRKTTLGASEELYYSENTVKMWINAFVKLVGRMAGF